MNQGLSLTFFVWKELRPLQKDENMFSPLIEWYVFNEYIIKDWVSGKFNWRRLTRVNHALRNAWSVRKEKKAESCLFFMYLCQMEEKREKL